MSSHFWVILHRAARNHPFGWGDTRHGISRAVLPICTAWVRRWEPSLSNSRLGWVLTVLSSRGVIPGPSRFLSSATNGSPAGMADNPDGGKQKACLA
jgi:hypothetical protein